MDLKIHNENELLLIVFTHTPLTQRKLSCVIFFFFIKKARYKQVFIVKLT